MARAVFRRLYEDNPGGKYARRVGHERWQTIEWTDMDDACGRDNEGEPRYVVELSEIDLLATSDVQRQSALDCCGIDLPAAQHEQVLVEALHDYGARAPLDSWSGNNLRRLLRAARKRAAEIEADADERDAVLSRPVNRLGSTAREFAQGDFRSAIDRAARAESAAISVDLHTVPSDDPLAFCVGLTRGLSGHGLEIDDRRDLAPEYVRGYQFGVDVRAGRIAAPSWVRLEDDNAS